MKMKSEFKDETDESKQSNVNKSRELGQDTDGNSASLSKTAQVGSRNGDSASEDKTNKGGSRNGNSESEDKTNKGKNKNGDSINKSSKNDNEDKNRFIGLRIKK